MATKRKKKRPKKVPEGLGCKDAVRLQHCLDSIQSAEEISATLSDVREERKPLWRRLFDWWR